MKKMSNSISQRKKKRDNPKLESDRIFKSATPKYTLDWYIVSGLQVSSSVAMSTRGMGDLLIWDLARVVGISL